MMYGSIFSVMKQLTPLMCMMSTVENVSSYKHLSVCYITSNSISSGCDICLYHHLRFTYITLYMEISCCM